MIIKRIELYDTVSKICEGSEYSIGLHGIDYGRVDTLVGINHDEVAENIVTTGLKIYHGRSINGTVKFFGRSDIEEDKENVQEGLNEYIYGSHDYILVAIPVILKTEKGDKLFLGSPNLDTIYKDYIGPRGYEKTTLLEQYITADFFDNNRIEPQYILGRFKLLDGDDIDLSINRRHIAFNNGLVSQEYYDNIKKKVMVYLKNSFERYSIPFDNTLIGSIDTVDSNELKRIISTLEQNNYRNHTLCETLRQLENEKNLTKIIK